MNFDKEVQTLKKKLSHGRHCFETELGIFIFGFAAGIVAVGAVVLALKHAS